MKTITEKQFIKAQQAVLKKDPKLNANDMITAIAKKLKCEFHEACNTWMMIGINEALSEMKKDNIK